MPVTFNTVTGNVIASNNLCAAGHYYIGTTGSYHYVFGTDAIDTLVVAQTYPSCPAPMVYHPANVSDIQAANILEPKVFLADAFYSGATPALGSYIVGGPVAYGSPSWFLPVTFDGTTGSITAPNNMCGGRYYIGTYGSYRYVFGTDAALFRK